MILDRLILKNFKRFRHAEIDFKDGITGILGNNGTGKSSLVTAIFFALYGVKGTGISGDYIVSSFAGPKDKCEVVLDFRIGGDTYRIIRTFRKGKTVSHDAELYRNKKLLAKEVSPVEEAVKRAIGMGPTDFRNTIYAAQRDLLTLLENTPGKRKEWFQKALGIDYLKTESDGILKKLVDAKTGELQRKEGELAAMAGRQSEDELHNLQESVKRFHATIAEQTQLRQKNLEHRAKLAETQKALAERKLAHGRLVQQQQALAKERDADTARKQKLEAQIALIAEEEAEYHRIEKTAGSYEDVRQRLEVLREKKNEHLRLSAELGFANREIADLSARVQKQKASLAALDADTMKLAELVTKVRSGLGAGEIAEDRLDASVSYRLAEINKRSGTLAAQVLQYQNETKKIEADLRTLRNAGSDGICPLCRQKLGDHFGSIEAEFSATLQELADKAVSDRERQEKLAKEKTTIESLRPLLDSMKTLAATLRQKPVFEEECAALTAKLEKKTREQKAISESIARLAYNDEACQACERENAELQKVQLRFIELGKTIGQGLMVKAHLAEMTTRIAGRTAELATLEEQIRAAAFDPAEASAVDAAILQADTALRTIEVTIAGATRDLQFTQEKIAAYHKAQEQIAALQNQAGELKDAIELLKLTRALIAEYVVYLMQVVRSRIEGEVSRIVSEITGGKYEQVLLDEDFNLLVRDIDNDYPVDRFSGGEQDDIAVALRIALSRYLAELHQVHESTFLIFDEIFGSQDEERRNNLLVALRTQESRFPQILLISHIAEIQGEFSNTLVVEQGTGNASTIREIT